MHRTSAPVPDKPAAPVAANRSRRHRPAPLNRLTSLGLCIGFAALVTLAVLQFSFRHGRLILFPTYDDVGYLADGATRLQALYDHGLGGLWDSYVQLPPHSPFQSVMVLVAFTFFGLHEWSPYVLNFLLALGYFLLADWLLRRVDFWQRALCFVFISTVPFVGMAVHEFRPDHAVALLTAIGIFLLLTGPFVHGPRRRQIAAGVWLGLALLAKPPVFPQTLALGGSALVLATIADWIAVQRRPRLGATVRAWLAVLIPFALIPLPHYAYDHRHIFNYIHEILFGKFKESYQVKVSLADHLRYYLTGPGGAEMLGGHAILLLAMLAIVGPAVLWRGSRRVRARMAMMPPLLVLAWIIPTVNQTKQPFFGLGFDTILLFFVVYLLGRFLLIERFSARGSGLWNNPHRKPPGLLSAKPGARGACPCDGIEQAPTRCFNRALHLRLCRLVAISMAHPFGRRLCRLGNPAAPDCSGRFRHDRLPQHLSSSRYRAVAGHGRGG